MCEKGTKISAKYTNIVTNIYSKIENMVGDDTNDIHEGKRYESATRYGIMYIYGVGLFSKYIKPTIGWMRYDHYSTKYMTFSNTFYSRNCFPWK